MELLQLLSEQTPAVALAITIWFFSNKEFIRFLQERREMIEALRLERKEFNDDLRVVLDRYHVDSRDSTEAEILMKSELHALKGSIGTQQLKIDTWMAREDRRGNQTGGKDGGNV